MLVVGNVLVAVFRVRLLEGLHAVHQAHGGDIRGAVSISSTHASLVPPM